MLGSNKDWMSTTKQQRRGGQLEGQEGEQRRGENRSHVSGAA